MAVRVRLFATLREAAGTSAVEVPAGSVPEVLDALTARFGPDFARHLPVCSVIVDGEPVPRDDTAGIPDGAEVALLPPVSGGATEAGEAVGLPFGEALASAAFAAGLVIAFAIRPGVLVAAVLLVAVAALVDLSELLARAAARPVLVAAALPAVALPVVAAMDPAVGWQRLPAFSALSLLVATSLALVFGRRARALDGLGATALAGLVIGLGASSVLLLAHLPEGFRWLVALGLTVAAADVAAPAASRIRGLSPSAVALGAPVAGIVAVGIAVTFLLQPPLTADRMLMVGAAVLVAGLGSRELAAAAQREGRNKTSGAVIGAVDGLLLAAPAVYVLARATAL